MLDIQKDVSILLFIKHSMLFVLLFAISITYPFFAFHRDVNLMKGEDGEYSIPSTSVFHSFLIYLGVTQNKRERLAREYAALQIAMYENQSQFMLIFYEMFNKRETITWV